MPAENVLPFRTELTIEIECADNLQFMRRFDDVASFVPHSRDYGGPGESARAKSL